MRGNSINTVQNINNPTTAIYIFGFKSITYLDFFDYMIGINYCSVRYN